MRTALSLLATVSLLVTQLAAAQGDTGTAVSETATQITPPRLVSSAELPYPKGAKGDHEVILELVVNADGRVSEVQITAGSEPFAELARNAAQDFRFEPARRDTTPVPSRIRVAVRFREPKSEAEAAGQRAGQIEHRTHPPAKVEDKAPIEITVTGIRAPEARSFSRAEVRQLPGAFGDPFRAIEAMPGVTPIVSGLPYFYVRGAPPGNVGYYFDGIRVPSLYHAGVGPAIIHPRFVEDVKLYSGAYPARYGRFAGGIVAADAGAPSGQFSGETSIRLVDAGALLEAPFAGGRGTATVAGRYSYTGLILSLIVPELSLGYWDYQARATYDVTARDRLSVFSFGASDYGSQTEAGGQKNTLFDLSFHRVDLRYDRRVSSGGTVRTAFTFGADRSTADDEAILAESRLFAGRIEYTQRLSRLVEVRAGADINHEAFRFERLETSARGEPDDVFEGFHGDQLSSHDVTSAGIRGDTVLRLGQGISVVPGARFDVYHSEGNTAFALEPRVSARFEISPRVALLHDVGIAHQTPSFVFPVPGFQPDMDEGLQLSLQSSAGVEISLPFEIKSSLIAYQNSLFNGTDLLGTSRLDNTDPSITERTRSLGHAVGLELMISRSLSRRLGGFISYTLARARRSVGKAEGPSTFDRTHTLNVALAYDLGKNYRIGGRTLFYTGIPADVGTLRAARTPPRTPPFWRFDFRFEKRWLIGESGAFWALVVESLNTTLNREVLNMSCAAYRCKKEEIGPISLPSIGVEASF